jgi:hypothetical protein
MRQGLEALYTNLTQFERHSFTIGTNESDSYTSTVSTALNTSISYSNSVTESHTDSRGTTKGATVGPDNAKQQKETAALQLLGTGLSLMVGGPGVALMQKVFFGQAIGNMASGVRNALADDPNKRTSVNDTSQETTTDGTAVQKGENKTEAQTVTEGANQGTTAGRSRSMQMTSQNKQVTGILAVVDEQLKALSGLEIAGAYNVCAYFVAGDRTTALSAANLYRSLLADGTQGGAAMPANAWDAPETAGELCRFLKRMAHPVFHFEALPDYPRVSAAQLVGPGDMARIAALPQASVPGFVVSDCAAFARDVYRRNSEGGADFPVGSVFHMGRREETAIGFPVDALSRHMFVTGTTGAGKSNFCYNLVDELVARGKKVLVVEPAKGEYAEVFGGRTDFHAFGTNGRLKPLLRINPFAFPAGVHVLEHIDRLIDIFNACWPMYAAMPAILKDALEECYAARGFDLVRGDCPAGARFPTFDDLLKSLPVVIKRSDYSGEVKGNYSGALVSRLRSLTNGLFRQIFTASELTDAELFDENVLVDLSRVGSAETKALIMGILVTRLNEYRMCSGAMNARLRHVTILEEAHHLLRRDAHGSAEGANMRAASTEMITNAIAEMRTYGEGFVIADQAPGLMDGAVIRNTHIKVAFRLPELDDRVIVGRAMALTDEQITELARLDTGVAAIYQGSWHEAVLCMTRKYPESRFSPYVRQARTEAQPLGAEEVGQHAALLIKGRVGDASSVDDGKIRAFLAADYAPDERAVETRAAFDSYLRAGAPKLSFADLCGRLDRILDGESLFALAGDDMRMADWAPRMRELIRARAVLGNRETDEVIALLIDARMAREPRMRALYARFAAYRQTGGQASVQK